MIFKEKAHANHRIITRHKTNYKLNLSYHIAKLLLWLVCIFKTKQFTGTISTQFENCLREIKRDYQLEILLNV